MGCKRLKGNDENTSFPGVLGSEVQEGRSFFFVVLFFLV